MTTERTFNETPVVSSPPHHSGVHECENSGIASDAANRGMCNESQQHAPAEAEGRVERHGDHLDSSNVQAHLELAHVRRAYVDYWSAREWTHFVVLTPAVAFTPDRLSREFNRYINRFRRLTKSAPICWLRVIERGEAGRYHLHALLWTSFPLAVRHLESLWDRGHAYVRRFNQDLDGVAYLLKEFSTDGWADSYDCSLELPPLRAGVQQREVLETSQFCAEGYAPPNSESRVSKREPLPSSQDGTSTLTNNSAAGGQCT